MWRKRVQQQQQKQQTWRLAGKEELGQQGGQAKAVKQQQEQSKHVSSNSSLGPSANSAMPCMYHQQPIVRLLLSSPSKSRMLLCLHVFDLLIHQDSAACLSSYSCRHARVTAGSMIEGRATAKADKWDEQAEFGKTGRRENQAPTRHKSGSQGGKSGHEDSATGEGNKKSV